jgi:hypothetical protein
MDTPPPHLFFALPPVMAPPSPCLLPNYLEMDLVFWMHQIAVVH